MLITFPIATIIAVLRVQIIQVLLERGAFDHKATIAVANVLAVLLLAFITTGLGNIVGKGFYISQRTKLLAILGITQSLLYFGYAYFLARYFSYIGLAISTSIYFFFPIIINTFIMRRIYNGINGRKIFNGFVKILVAAVSSGICVYLAFISFGPKQSLIMKTGTCVIVGFLCYSIVILYWLRVEEAEKMKQEVYRKMSSWRLKFSSWRATWDDI